MSHSSVCSIYHVVFSTKQRTQLIPPPSQSRLWNYLAGIARNHAIQPIAIGGTENHVHLLLHLPPELAICDAVRTLKANSSKFMRGSSRFFAWQEGYGAFTVSPSHVEGVKQYVANQAHHHARRSFEEELATMVNAADLCVAPEGALEF
jgi:putative transposase